MAAPTQSQPGGSPLGDLQKLPLELRQAIYNYWLDEDCKPYGHFRNGSLVVARTEFTTGFVGASKTIQNEIGQCVLTDRAHEINISLDGFQTSFPFPGFVEIGTEDKQTYTATALTLPSCKQLALRIHIPSPRHAAAFAYLRRSVAEVVRLLNTSCRDIPAKLHVSLESVDKSGHSITYSDYSMLLGPLGEIEFAQRGVKIMLSKAPSKDRVYARCLLQSKLIESAASGNHNYLPYELQQQQLLNDVYIELACYEDVETAAGLWALEIRFWRRRTVGAKGARRLTSLLSRLLELYKKSGMDEDSLRSSWEKKLLDNLKETGRDTILPATGSSFHEWAAGLSTSSNPCW